MKVDPHLKNRRARWRTGLAFGWLLALPGIAHAQYAPGALLNAAPPALNNGQAGNGIFGAAPNFFGHGAPGPAVANPPDFLWSAYAGLNGRYTTNAQGSSAGGSSDFDLQGQFGVAATETSRRVNAWLNYEGRLDYFTSTASNIVVSNNLNANGLVEILQDHLYLSATAFASPVYSSQLGNIAPAGETLPPGSNSDLRNTYGFSVSPDLTFRLGDFLRSDTIPVYSAVYIDTPTGAGTGPLAGISSNIAVKALTQRLSTGDYFSRLQLSAIGNYTELGKSSAGLTQRSATGQMGYAITHEISVIGSAGYQSVTADIPLGTGLSGPVFLGGLRFNTPHLSGQVFVGEQFNGLSVVGNLAYQIDPNLALNATATDEVTTPGANLLDPSALVTGIISGIASGQIQIPASGILSLNAVDLAGIGLQNTPVHIRDQSLSLQYFGLDRLSAIISANLQSQDTVAGALPGQNLHMSQFSIVPSLNYAFSQDFSGGVDFAYSQQTLAFGRSNVEEFRIHAGYLISDRMSVFAEADYFQRNSNPALSAVSANSGSVSATSIGLGIRRQF